MEQEQAETPEQYNQKQPGPIEIDYDSPDLTSEYDFIATSLDFLLDCSPRQQDRVMQFIASKLNEVNAKKQVSP